MHAKCNKNMYVQGSNIHFVLLYVVPHRVQEDGAVEVLRRMDYLIANQIGLPSHTIEEANQEV